MAPLQPIFLLADSQLLFWRENGHLLLERILKASTRDRLKAAYVGASNGDHPDFYAIFVAAMEGVSLFDCRMISSTFSEADLAFLNDADIILLAGGDVELGWRTFLTNGLDKHIVRRYFEGASLIGISAGAVQLGLGCLAADGSLIETFKLAPFIIGAHEESNNWKSTLELLRLSGTNTRAIGLPAGGGAIYHQDHTVEPLRHPLVELSLREGNAHQTFIRARVLA
jgi:cyanophycinase